LSNEASAISLKADRLVAGGHFQSALPLYQEALKRDPHRPDDWFNLAVCLRRTGEDEQALNAYQEALNYGVSGPEEVLLNRAVILSDQLNRPAEALQDLRAALAIRPDYVAALLNLGNLHEELGEAREATACYERLLELSQLDPNHRARALARLTHLKPPKAVGDPAFDSLSKAASQAGLDPVIAASLHLASARALDRLGQVDPAFKAMSRGKALLARVGPAYRPKQVEARVDELIRAFPDVESIPAPAPSDRPRPVFILGLYRSGSSLVEQMLSAHPDVLTGGELDILPRLFGNPFSSDQRRELAPDAAVLDQFGSRYWQLLGQRFDDLDQAKVVTDKRLDNHFLVGFLAKMFPEARFIHTHRHPLDNALSIFMQHLDSGWVPYANRFQDISHFSIQTRRLINHWRTVLPDRIQECNYDQLVHDPETNLKDILQFLDLPWDPRCLNFHMHAGQVQTASYWQVRNPLYQKASGRWRRYAHHLQSLKRSLQPLLEATDSSLS